MLTNLLLDLLLSDKDLEANAYTYLTWTNFDKNELCTKITEEKITEDIFDELYFQLNLPPLNNIFKRLEDVYFKSLIGSKSKLASFSVFLF